MIPYTNSYRDDREQDLADYLANIYQDSIEEPLQADEEEDLL